MPDRQSGQLSKAACAVVVGGELLGLVLTGLVGVPVYNALRPMATDLALQMADSGRVGIDFLLTSEFVLNQVFGVALTTSCLALPAEILIFRFFSQRRA